MTYPTWGRAGTGGGGGTDPQTATNTASVSANDADIAEILTALGIADGDTNMGAFAGDIIASGGNVHDALSALEAAIEGIAGQYLGAAATFATLPEPAFATAGDWAALTADVIGTGDAANPQYPRGVYLFDGTLFAFAFELGGGSAEGGGLSYIGPFTAGQNIAAATLIGDKIGVAFDTTAGALTAIIDAGLADDVEIEISRRGGNGLTISSAGADTFGGDATAELNEQGFVRIKKSGTNWDIVSAGRSTQVAAAAATADVYVPGDVVADDGEFFGKAGRWANHSGGNLTIPTTPSAANMAAAGFTYLAGLT